jgi:hypothetical protein
MIGGVETPHWGVFFMRRKARWTRGKRSDRWVAALLAALLAGLAGGALQGATTATAPATRRGTTASAPASATASTRATTSSAPASTRASTSSSAPATTTTATASATRPALLADTILSKFPGNASVVLSRPDVRNFTVEGRVRDVRTVNLDGAGNIVLSAAAGGKTELRVTLVGRSQADEVAAHFACRFDKATQEAAAKLKPNQTVRLTGSVAGGAAVTAADRLDLLNCRDLADASPLNVGEQLVGYWRCNDVQVDGAALRKANQAKGVKTDTTPDGNYTAPWHIDLALRADGTLTAELAENTGPSIKRLTGRYFIVKDAATEAKVRLDVQGTGSQEATVALEEGRLKLSLPGLADKFVLPETRFGKLEGIPRPMDYRVFKDQTLQWFNANLARPDNNLPKTVSDVLDEAANRQQGFTFTLGPGASVRGRGTLLLGGYGKLMPLEYTDIETRVANLQPNSVGYGYLPNWGTLMTPEVKIEALTVDNRNGFDPGKQLTGKITLRGLRRMVDSQYMLAAISGGGISTMPIDAPGPDPQIYDVQMAPPPGAAGPRPMVFLVGRQAKPGDLFGDNANRVISEPAPMILDVLPPR